jgi:hypothetical protein
VALVIDRIYEKPWYEYNAFHLIEMIKVFQVGIDVEHPDEYTISNLLRCAGQLGRAVEQYYWRLHHERDAVTGAGAKRGASAGGLARASQHQLERLRWLKKAAEISSRHPKWSTMAVAEQIRKDLCVPRTAKHIARAIRRPVRKK